MPLTKEEIKEIAKKFKREEKPKTEKEKPKLSESSRT